MAESESNVYDSDESDSDLSSIGSESSSAYKKNKRFPTQATDWTLDHLTALGVKYGENATDLKTFMSKLKTVNIDRTLGKMPKICNTLKQLTTEKWSFSCNLEKDKGGGIKDAMETTEKTIEDFVNEQGMDERVKQEDEKKMRLFFIWRFNILNFWRYLLTLLARWDKPQREGRYTNLFMAFSKIFFLHPETGSSVCDAIGIKDSSVHGIPDIRYTTMANETSQILTVTEVKPYNAFTGEYNEETFTFKHIGKNVLGRHGIKLIMEAIESFFFPYVVGLLCIGTKIIFTYLYIEREDYYSLRESGYIQKPNKASISYTRPFDFMDSGDRQSILDSFFWFGFVQSHGYKY
ncbi:uncharacterized protein LOC133195017 [Saccostrea echinata]|uniref:uncharacterized protein LOC133195017 n=1 Tax=Saccostrea echinata TaxID=191078 RepID=UPI002A8330A0|nr:uncharacterized protein LOC133195017 [Saccostrea echinata]